MTEVILWYTNALRSKSDAHRTYFRFNELQDCLNRFKICALRFSIHIIIHQLSCTQILRRIRRLYIEPIGAEYMSNEHRTYSFLTKTTIKRQLQAQKGNKETKTKYFICRETLANFRPCTPTSKPILKQKLSLQFSNSRILIWNTIYTNQEYLYLLLGTTGRALPIA